MYNRKSAEASRRGRKNRAEGEVFELLIQDACDEYKRRRLAWIDKTPEPFKVTGNPDAKGRFVGYFKKQAQPDFKGVVLGGRAIVFDAKATSTGKINLSCLTDEQRESLVGQRMLGAISGVMMCFNAPYVGFKSRYFFLPIDRFVAAKQLNGHKYWSAEDAAKYGNEIRLDSLRRPYFLGQEKEIANIDERYPRYWEALESEVAK